MNSELMNEKVSDNRFSLNNGYSAALTYLSIALTALCVGIMLFPFIEELDLDHDIYNYLLLIGVIVLYFVVVILSIGFLNEDVEKEIYKNGIQSTNILIRRFFIIQTMLSLLFLSNSIITKFDLLNQTAFGWTLLSPIGYILLPIYSNKIYYKLLTFSICLVFFILTFYLGIFQKYEIIERSKTLIAIFGILGAQWSLSFSNNQY